MMIAGEIIAEGDLKGGDQTHFLISLNLKKIILKSLSEYWLLFMYKLFKDKSLFEQLTVHLFFGNFLPMSGFEPRTSGIGSDRSAN